MSIERWGALSVADHTDLVALTANVMIYDRLVMPMCTEADDRNERDYWLAHGWDPDLQAVRREQLGELVIESAWDSNRRQSYASRFEAAQQLNQEVSGEMITRWLLTSEQDYQLPPGVNHTDIFVAYNSKASAQQDLALTANDAELMDENSKVVVGLASDMGVPNIAEPEVAFKEAIALSKDREFRKKRADLYSFQMSCFHKGMSAKAIVAELQERNEELNIFLKKQKFSMYKKTCFMLAGTSLGVVGGAFLGPVGALGGLLSLWQFAAFSANAAPVLPNHLIPVAAYHEMKKVAGGQNKVLD